jgi:signal peptidase I
MNQVLTNLTITLVTLLLCFLLLRWIIRAAFLVVVVQHNSMLPTLSENDRVLVCTFWPIKWLGRGQIVVLRPWAGLVYDEPHPAMKDTLYIKRITALSGDIVSEEIKLPEWAWPPTDGSGESASNLRTWHVPPGHVFVRGDNQTASHDSMIWGPAPFHSIVGIMISKLPTKEKRITPTFAAQNYVRPTWGPPQGVKAPDFAVSTLDGEHVTLSTYEGRSVTFIFMSLRDTGTARALIKSFEEIAPKAAKHGVELVLVNVADRVKTAEYAHHLHTTLPILSAPANSSTFMKDYRILGWPAYCLLDEQGITRLAGPIISASGEWRRLVESWLRAEQQF